MQGDGRLTPEAASRVGRSVELFHGGYATTITVTGPRAVIHNGISDLEAHKRAMLFSGVPLALLFEEGDSLDTIGQLLFAKQSIIVPNNMEKVVIVSSLYHKNRCCTIARIVYGSNFYIDFEGCKCRQQVADGTLKKREKIA